MTEIIVTKYREEPAIAKELQDLKDDLENGLAYLNIDDTGEISFLKCQQCHGPVWGHRNPRNTAENCVYRKENIQWTPEQVLAVENYLTKLDNFDHLAMICDVRGRYRNCNDCNAPRFNNTYLLAEHLRSAHNTSDADMLRLIPMKNIMNRSGISQPRHTFDDPNGISSLPTNQEQIDDEGRRHLTTLLTNLLSGTNSSRGTPTSGTPPASQGSNTPITNARGPAQITSIKPRVVPEWYTYLDFEIIRQEWVLWDEHETAVPNSAKYHQLTSSLMKNQHIKGLAHYTQTEIMEKLNSTGLQTVANVLALLDKQFLGTTNQKMHSILKDFRHFEDQQFPSHVELWKCLNRIRARYLRIKEVHKFDLFLLTAGINKLKNSSLLKETESYHIEEKFKSDFGSSNIFSDITKDIENIRSEESRHEVSANYMDKAESFENVDMPADVHYGGTYRGNNFRGRSSNRGQYMQRGRSPYKQKPNTKFYRSKTNTAYFYKNPRTPSQFERARSQSPNGQRFRSSSRPNMYRKRGEMKGNRNDMMESKLTEMHSMLVKLLARNNINANYVPQDSNNSPIANTQLPDYDGIGVNYASTLPNTQVQALQPLPVYRGGRDIVPITTSHYGTSQGNTIPVVDVHLSNDTLAFTSGPHSQTILQIIIDSGCPNTLIGRKLFLNYLKTYDLDISSLPFQPDEKYFRFGSSCFYSKGTYLIPVKLKDSKGRCHILQFKTFIVEGDVPYLLGGDVMFELDIFIGMRQKTIDIFDKNMQQRLTFKPTDPSIGHIKLDLMPLKEMKQYKAVKLIKKSYHIWLEGSVNTNIEQEEFPYHKVKEIHERTYHKQSRNLKYAFDTAGLLNPTVTKHIDKVIENCKVCIQSRKAPSKPDKTLPKVSHFNEIISMDLKQMGDKYVLWMLDTLTRFIKGTVVKDKKPQTIINALHRKWICNFGIPTKGFYSDNGGEFNNWELAELSKNLNFNISCSASYSPWQNGMNERNHAVCDIIVKKLRSTRTDIDLDTAVAMAQWCHNTNLNRLGYTPLFLLTGSSVVLPTFTNGSIQNLADIDSKDIEKLIDAHNILKMEFVKSEMRLKLNEIANSKRLKYKYHNYNQGDQVLIRRMGKVGWYGPCKVIWQNTTTIFVLCNSDIVRVSRPNIMPYGELTPELNNELATPEPNISKSILSNRLTGKSQETSNTEKPSNSYSNSETNHDPSPTSKTILPKAPNTRSKAVEDLANLFEPLSSKYLLNTVLGKTQKNLSTTDISSNTRSKVKFDEKVKFFLGDKVYLNTSENNLGNNNSNGNNHENISFLQKSLVSDSPEIDPHCLSEQSIHIADSLLHKPPVVCEYIAPRKQDITSVEGTTIDCFVKGDNEMGLVEQSETNSKVSTQSEIIPNDCINCVFHADNIRESIRENIENLELTMSQSTENNVENSNPKQMENSKNTLTPNQSNLLTDNPSVFYGKQYLTNRESDDMIFYMDTMDTADSSVYAIELGVKEHKRPDVVSAKQKQLQDLVTFSTYEEIEDKGQTVIGSRWVITEKQVHDSQKVKVKARLVIRGFQEKVQPQADSPTAHKDSLKTFLSIAANEELELMSIDVTAAYMQGNKMDREIFIRPPPDIRATNGGKIWKLLRPLPGTSDAGRKWYYRIGADLKRWGFQILEQDQAVFYKVNSQGKLICVIVLHVDDFMCAGSNDYLKILEGLMKSVVSVSKTEHNSFRYCGMDITKTKHGITLGMEDYAKQFVHIPNFRQGKGTDPLNSHEIKILRRFIGQLAWLSGNSRPDLAFIAMQLSTIVTKATLADLKSINRIIDIIHSRHSKVIFKKVGNKEDLQILGVSDGAYSSSVRPKAGFLIMLSNKNNCNVSPLTWKSKTIQQVCKCSKDSETRALAMNTDRSINASNILNTLLFNSHKEKQVTVKIMTDSIPLLDSIASTATVKSCYMASEIRALQDFLTQGLVKSYSWLDTKEMVADMLTKAMKESSLVRDIFFYGKFLYSQQQKNFVEYQGEEIRIRNLFDKNGVRNHGRGGV